MTDALPTESESANLDTGESESESGSSDELTWEEESSETTESTRKRFSGGSWLSCEAESSRPLLRKAISWVQDLKEDWIGSRAFWSKIETLDNKSLFNGESVWTCKSSFIGKNAGDSHTTGNRNAAIGHGALNANTTGARNAAVGFQA